jgi:hypothetical protein
LLPAHSTDTQSAASRCNGARSAGPVTAVGKACSARNATRHGLAGASLFLLADEDPEDYASHEALWLRTLNPTDLAEREAALAAVRALWRESRADRLEAQVLNDLFAADDLEDEAEAKAVKRAAWRALSTLLRYRARVQREHDRARRELDALRQRPRQLAPAAVRSEPEPVPAATAPPCLRPVVPPTALPDEPEPPRALNRHQRRALAAMRRKRAA